MINIFVGSSAEGEKHAAKAINYLKTSISTPILWRNAFPAGESAIDSLIRNTDKFDFAVLIMTGDDHIVSRSIEYKSARDNILFELGLFMGKLGNKRVFILEESKAKIKIASDLEGITRPRFQDDIEDSLKAACVQILERVKAIGPCRVVSSVYFGAPGKAWHLNYKFDQEGEKLHNWGNKRRTPNLFRGISLYWLAHDMLWTVCALITRQGTDQIRRGLIQIAWQMEQSGFFDNQFYGWIRNQVQLKDFTDKYADYQARIAAAEMILKTSHGIGDDLNRIYKDNPKKNAPDEYLPLPPRLQLPKNEIENRPYKWPE